MIKYFDRRALLLCGIASFLLACGGAIAGDCAVQAASRAASGKIVITPERLLADYSTVSGNLPSAQWLPDARHLIFTTASLGSSAAGGIPWIEKMEIATGKRVRLVRGLHPKVSPDGSALLFISGEGKERQLALYDIAGGGIRKLVPFPEGMIGVDQSFAWSPDSRRVAYGYRPAAPAKDISKDANGSSVLVVGSAGDVPLDSEIWILDVAGGSPRRLATDASMLNDAGWSADGKSLIFTSMGGFEYRNDNVTGKIFAISVASGEKTDLVTNGGVQALRPVVSPDGRQVAFTYDPNNLIYPYFWNIATIAPTGGPVRQLTRELFVASGPVWSPDNRNIYFTCKRAVFSQICAVDLAGKVRELTSAPRNASSIAVSPRGDRLAWTTQDAEGRVEIRAARTDGTGEKVLADFNPELANLALGDVEEISWKSRDGLRIPGLLIKPLGYQSGKKYKLLVDIHGGPVGGVALRGNILKSTPLEWQMWAAKGYAVLVPDYRGSTVPGWGPVLKARENQDYNARDMDDVMSGVDHVIALGIADPDKLAVIGHSAGSILTNWIVTHSGRFKVAVSYEGWVDMYHGYGSGLRVGGNSIAEWMYKGKPWEVPENYRKNSASGFVKGVTTPTMFIAGDYGGGSGVENLYHHEFMYSAWRQQNVDTQLLIYRGEGHVIQQPENQRDMMTRILDWIESRIE
ncbi:S9 family peptidase [Sphingosinicella rhizophila]|uniref:Prolyl oligopeptidase family serine peptidase n=1 Tax=Sphingosinicella rhizophila TaxID=3050082 RepID=A0ABU3QAF3_9SPHN|nr:prolyl oligopeptidase family serine peptidase [Sphingosinicella sp. GR2756]MDT9600109.1 prolyl oligopeptidase family serine peptidase [Sphingosinicella sp. GR2756]